MFIDQKKLIVEQQKASIIEAAQQIHITEGTIEGENIHNSQKTIGDLVNIFENEDVRKNMNQEQVVYRVQAYLPVSQGTDGGLYFGTTWILPGMVENEYFMTQGHSHKLSDRCEFYWGLKGEGVLILMDKNRKCWGERMHTGSLHYIPAHTAHRVANTGNDELVFSACWPSDAGYNYDEILTNGFSCRLISTKGQTELVQID